jgi:deoxyribonuclease-4
MPAGSAATGREDVKVLAFGSHTSAAGGCDQAIVRAMELGMESCQLFTKNERQWMAKPLDPAVIERFRAKTVESGFDGRLVAHDSYLINIASPDDALRERSRLALREELDRCDQLGIPYLVSHPGAHVGSGVEAGLARVAESINLIHAERPDGRAMLLLETTAGQGTTLGRTFDELAEIIARLDDPARVGICFDTCHTFAAGYELRTAEGYAATMAELDRVIGLDRVKVFHFNDSKFPLGSHKDRHAHIGEGELGLEAFRHLVNDSRFCGRPAILETEKDPAGEDDRRNLATLRSLVAEVDEANQLH